MSNTERQDDGEVFAGANEILARIHRLRSRTGFVALIVSVIIHSFLLWQLSTMSWSLLSKAERMPRPQKVIKLGEVRFVPTPQPVRPAKFRPENPNLMAVGDFQAESLVE